MPTQSSQTTDPRRPVYSGNRRVTGLTERTRRDGRVIYEARVRFDPGGPLERVVLDATTKTTAITELQALKVDRRRGEPVRTGSTIPTVREVAAEWLDWFALRVNHRDPRKRRSPRTLALYRDRMERHVLPTIGSLPINEVSVADLRRLVDRLGAKLAPSTVTADISMTSALMRYAVKQRLIAHNPIRDLDRDDRPGSGRQSKPRYLAADEVASLLAAMTDTFRPVAATAAYAGLRISEVLGLSWADVDFTAKQIHVRRQLDPGGIRNVTKTRASTAAVPLLPALERELREHRSRQAGINLRLVRSDALVFTTARGKPQSRRNALRAVHKAGDNAGLNPEGTEQVGLHDLRHSFVAIALDSGATLAEAAVLARHANAKVTGAIYAGVNEQAKAKIAGKLTAAGFGS